MQRMEAFISTLALIAMQRARWQALATSGKVVVQALEGGGLGSDRQLDVRKPVVTALQFLLQLLHGLPRFQRCGTGYGPLYGLRAGLGRLWIGGLVFGHDGVVWQPNCLPS